MEEYIKPEKDEVFNGGIFYVMTGVDPNIKYEKVEILGSSYQKDILHIKHVDSGNVDKDFPFFAIYKKVE